MDNLPVRKPNRLQNFDYSRNGAYFITICTKNKFEYFGKIKPAVGAGIARPQPRIYLSEYGMIVENVINEINIHYPMVNVVKYVIMPNHIHIIFSICNEPDVNTGRAMPAPTISRIVNQMKGIISKQIGFPIWQRSFYDRIIRDHHEYMAYWKYIDSNPINWENDELYNSHGG